jgi:two-component system, cell cycle response regulator
MTWRILIVDDEEDVRMIVRTTLESKYEVVEAHDGLDALEKVDRYQPDFVVMDVMMPLMNGFDACATLRKNPKFAKLPVLFLSALGSKEDMKKGYSAGANLYLTKPFEPPRLMRNIDLFFERTPPSEKSKRYSLAQIKEAEKNGRRPTAPGAAHFESSSAAGEKTAEPQIATTTATTGARLRVMVVDDDPEMCTLIRLGLMEMADVVMAHDGMMAIERLVRYQPDMLVIDVMLPRMNGYQLVQSLRANRAFAHMPIMMCSARGTDRDVTLGKRVGADEYLVKPFGTRELVTKITALTKLPGFRVRPKKLALEQIDGLERPKEEDDVFRADDEARLTKESSSKEVLGSFLAKESGKDPLGHDEEPHVKKRRLFGFGRD